MKKSIFWIGLSVITLNLLGMNARNAPSEKNWQYTLPYQIETDLHSHLGYNDEGSQNNLLDSSFIGMDPLLDSSLIGGNSLLNTPMEGQRTLLNPPMMGENSLLNTSIREIPCQFDMRLQSSDFLNRESSRDSLLDMHMQSMQFAYQKIQKLNQIILLSKTKIRELENELLYYKNQQNIDSAISSFPKPSSTIDKNATLSEIMEGTKAQDELALEEQGNNVVNLENKEQNAQNIVNSKEQGTSIVKEFSSVSETKIQELENELLYYKNQQNIDSAISPFLKFSSTMDENATLSEIIERTKAQDELVLEEQGNNVVNLEHEEQNAQNIVNSKEQGTSIVKEFSLISEVQDELVLEEQGNNVVNPKNEEQNAQNIVNSKKRGTSIVKEFSLISDSEESETDLEMIESGVFLEKIEDVFGKISKLSENFENLIGNAKLNKMLLNKILEQHEEIETLRKEESNYLEDISSLTSKFEELKSKTDKLEEQLKINSEKMKDQKNQLKEADQAIKLGKAEFEHMELAKNEELRKQREKEKNYLEKIQEQHEEIETLRKEESNYLEDISSLTSKFEELKSKTDKLEEQLKINSEKMKDQKNQLKEADQAIKLGKAEFEHMELAKNEELRKQREKEKNYLEKIQEQQKIIETYQQKEKSSIKKEKGLQKKIQEQKKDFERTLNDVINGAHINVINVNKETKENINSLKKQLKKADDEIKSQKEKLDSVNVDKESIKAKLLQVEEEYSLFKQNKNEEIQKLQKTVEVYKQKENDSLKKYESLAKENESMNQVLSQKDKEIEDLKQQLKKIMDQKQENETHRPKETAFDNQSEEQQAKLLREVLREKYDEFGSVLKESNIDKVLNLISIYPQLVNELSSQGWTLIMRVSGNNQINKQDKYKIIESLLIANKKINGDDTTMINKKSFDEGDTALHVAISQRDPEIIHLLLKYGANPYIKNSRGWTPLIGGVICNTNGDEEGKYEIVRALLEANEKIGGDNNKMINMRLPDKDSSILHVAASHKNLKIIRLLLKYGVNPDIQNNKKWTPLLLAVCNKKISKENRYEMVKALLNANKAINGSNEMINRRLLEGDSALAMAMLQDDPEMIILLLRYGANPCIQNKEGWTPLMRLICNHRIKERDKYKIVEALLDVTKKIEGDTITMINRQLADGDTVLNLAVKNPEIMELLLKNGANPDIPNKEGWTPLMRVVCDDIIRRKDKYRIVEALLKANKAINGDNTKMVNRQLPEGSSVLHMATEKICPEIIKLLLENGADPDIQNNSGRNPLFNVFCNNKIDEQSKYEIVKALLDANKKIKGSNTKMVNRKEFSRNCSVLNMASEHCCYEIIILLLKYGADPDTQNKNKWTPLTNVICNNKINKQDKYEIVKELIATNRKIRDDSTRILNVRLSDDSSVLCLASKYGYFDIVSLLLEHGADPNILNKYGWGPLTFAAKYGYPNIVKKLIEYGTDIYTETSSGENVLTIAMNSSDIRSEEDRIDIIRNIIESDPRIIWYKNRKGFSALSEAGRLKLLDIKSLFFDYKNAWECFLENSSGYDNRKSKNLTRVERLLLKYKDKWKNLSNNFHSHTERDCREYFQRSSDNKRRYGSEDNSTEGNATKRFRGNGGQSINFKS